MMPSSTGAAARACRTHGPGRGIGQVHGAPSAAYPWNDSCGWNARGCGFPFSASRTHMLLRLRLPFMIGRSVLQTSITTLRRSYMHRHRCNTDCQQCTNVAPSCSCQHPRSIPSTHSLQARACGLVKVLEVLDKVDADADVAALAARARLEQLKVLVDGHRIQDVVHEDACGTAHSLSGKSPQERRKEVHLEMHSTQPAASAAQGLPGWGMPMVMQSPWSFQTTPALVYISQMLKYFVSKGGVRHAQKDPRHNIRPGMSLSYRSTATVLGCTFK